MQRRTFLNVCCSGLSGLGESKAARRIEAIAFDALAVFDARPVAMMASDMWPEKGRELSMLWRSRQFEYTWLRTLEGEYADFWQVTEDALRYAARALQVELSASARDALMASWLRLPGWGDAAPALQQLTAAGIRLALLSNFTPKMLHAAMDRSGLHSYFEQVCSCDRVRAYKPAAIAYHMALDAFRLRREQIAFAAAAGWDATGAKRFGFRTFWVNRGQAPAEEIAGKPDGLGSTLHDLAGFILGPRD